MIRHGLRFAHQSFSPSRKRMTGRVADVEQLEAAMGGRKHLEGDYKDKRAQFDGMAAGLQQLWPPVEGVDVEST